MNLPDLSKINLTSMPRIERESRGKNHFNEIRGLYERVKHIKKKDQTIAIALHFGSGIIHVKQIYTADAGALLFETYEDNSHTFMLVPVEQCVVSFHLFKPEESFEKPFMGFPSSPT